MRAPWNGGSSSLRVRRCGRSSSTSTECGPTTGPSTWLPSPACSCAGSPVKILLTSRGSLTTTSGSNGHTFEREHVAVAAVVALEHPVLRGEEADALDGAREPRPGQRGATADQHGAIILLRSRDAL